MLKTVEAVIEKNGTVKFKETVKLRPSQKVLVTLLDDPADRYADSILSEKALAEDWLRPEEEKAWAHLQKAQ